MKNFFVASLLTGLLVPAHAGVYKCVVDGQVTYQAQACDADRPPVGPPRESGASRPETPAADRRAETPPESSVFSGQSQPKQAVSSAAPGRPAFDAGPQAREAFAREAFRLLVTDLSRFESWLCANSGYLQPGMTGQLKKSADALARQWVEIGEVIRHQRSGVLFAATRRQNGPAGVQRVSDPMAFSVGIGRQPDGSSCISGFGGTRK
ncbi:MAG: hypothetical protein R3E68_04975 [Burkholderiaceae bacterium]